MSKKCIGFDIGTRFVHVAVREGGKIGRVLNVEAPEGLVRDGQILSYEAMGDFLRDLRKEQKLRTKRAALVLPASQCYCRRFTTAYMSESQLKFNLPYEFRDFISGEKEEYYYDYSVVNISRDAEGKPMELDLMAAAVKKTLVADLMEMFRKAGMKLVTLAPEELAYINLLRAGGDTGHGHCVLDLGYGAMKLYMFTGDRFESVRMMDFGCAALVAAVADHFGVDEHIAATYLTADYNGCTRLPRCMDIYNAIAVEVTKAVNFYRFNSGGEDLEHIHLGGGGTRNLALTDTLRRSMGLEVEDMSEFWPELDESTAAEASVAAAAVGAAIQ